MSKIRLYSSVSLTFCNMLILYFHIFPFCITTCTTLINLFNILVVVELLIKTFYYYQNKNCSSIYKSIIMTSPIGFDIVLTNFEATLKQRWDCAVSTLFLCCATLFRLCFNVGHWRCMNFVQRWKSDDGICFIFNVRSTLLQRWYTTLKLRWSNVEMLAG